jgi:hypothetical protein
MLTRLKLVLPNLLFRYKNTRFDELENLFNLSDIIIKKSNNDKYYLMAKIPQFSYIQYLVADGYTLLPTCGEKFIEE